MLVNSVKYSMPMNAVELQSYENGTTSRNVCPVIATSSAIKSRAMCKPGPQVAVENTDRNKIIAVMYIYIW